VAPADVRLYSSSLFIVFSWSLSLASNGPNARSNVYCHPSRLLPPRLPNFSYISFNIRPAMHFLPSRSSRSFMFPLLRLKLDRTPRTQVHPAVSSGSFRTLSSGTCQFLELRRIDLRDVARQHFLLTLIRSIITKCVASSESVRDAWIWDYASSIQ